MRQENSEKKLIKYVVVIFSILLIIQVIILVRNNSSSDTKSDKQTGEEFLKYQASENSPVFNIQCSDPILKLKDSYEDWCERECRINNMTKIDYNYKENKLWCYCNKQRFEVLK